MSDIHTIFGYTFKNSKLLDEALTHPSFKHIEDTDKDYNRLEFLGDSVVNLIISEIIFKQYPDIDEGELSILHSALVNKNRLADVARIHGINDWIKMDNGEVKNGGRNNRNNLEDTVEAIIGAIFLDSDYNEVKEVVSEVWGEFLSTVIIQKDSKSELQEWLQQNHRMLPSYNVVSQTGAAHQPEFVIEVELHDGKKFRATSSVKKQAEFEAAKLALEYIEKLDEHDGTQ